MVKVAVMGYGVIGSGVVEVLRTNKDIVAGHAGTGIEVTRVLDLKDLSGTPVEDIWTKDFNDILNDPEVDIVVEVMGGTGAAYKFVKASLEAGKSVVTSNKALVAAYGPELIAIAKEKNINFMFEASVGGGIPIIRPLQRCITADEILEITGILNGTTNYILTKMYDEGTDFDDALRQAQAKGFAEADPSADIEGADACRKIAILASLAYGRFVDFQDIPCKGITDIDSTDIAYARLMGKKIRLFGSARNDNGRIYAEVSPFFVSSSDPLFGVDGVMNAIKVRGNMLGEVMFYGAGAGSLPTASAVVSDIIVEASHLHENIPTRMDAEKLSLESSLEEKDDYLIRLRNGVSLGAEYSESIDGAAINEYAVIVKGISGAQLEEILAIEGVIKAIKIR